MAARDLILGTVEDLALSFVAYDRKGDEDLPEGVIEGAVEAGEITVDEIAAKFREALAACLAGE